MQNSIYSNNHYVIKQLKKRIKRKSKHAFQTNVDEIRSDISDAYKIGKRFVGKSAMEIDTASYKKVCQRICRALAVFSDITDWLHDIISLDAKLNSKRNIRLEESWIDIARAILKALEELTYAYTTYSDSLGMTGDYSISNLFLNVEEYKEEKPYFPDNLTQAAEILFENGELELATRYSLISAIEAIWDQYRYEKDDAFTALMTIPWLFEEQKRYDESVDYIVKTLEWLYEFHVNWEGQEYEELYIHYLQCELRERLDNITEETRQKATESFQRIVETIEKKNLEIDDMLLLSAIEILERLGRLNDAFRIVRAILT